MNPKPHFGIKPPKNPSHHQIGKLPNYLQSLSLHLNWLVFQLRSMRGNLENPRRNIEDDIRSRNFMNFDPAERTMLHSIYSDAKHLQESVQALEKKILEFNKSKSAGYTKPVRGGG